MRSGKWIRPGSDIEFNVKLSGRRIYRRSERAKRDIPGSQQSCAGWVLKVRDNCICVYCGKEAKQADHVIPHKLGGPSWTGNLVATCRSCNIKKGRRLPLEMINKALRHLEAEGENMEWVYEYCSKVQKLRGLVSTAETLATLLQLVMPRELVEVGAGVSKADDRKGLTPILT